MDTEWMARGNCAHESPSTFFPSDGVGVEVGASASADVAGAVVGDVGGSTVVGLRVEVGVAALVRDVGGSTEVGVRVGPVGAVAVTLGSVTLGAGRVPERSVEGRVADSLPSPAPQPLSQRDRPSTSPAENHALPARRPRMRGATRRSLLAGTTRCEIIQDVRINDHLRSNQVRRGARPACDAGHSSARDPSPASPEAGENTVPHRACLHVQGPGGTDGTER